MLKSVNELASLIGADRATVIRRADQLNLVPDDGPKGAKLYETRQLLQLVPIPTRNSSADSSTLEEARIKQTLADARVKELTAQKLEGTLADVEELLMAQNEIMDDVAALIKRSSMAQNEKEEILEKITEAARAWENRR
jgi:hypothetical protein